MNQEDEQVTEETLDTQEEVSLENDDSQDEQEDVEALKERLAKADELAKNYKIRAEKAESAAKAKKEVELSTTGTLSAKEILALSKSGIDPEDLDEVLDYAGTKRIPISEALKSTAVRAILQEKAEERKSAQAVHTGATRRASTSISDERLIADARKGIMPESDADMQRLVQLRRKN